MPRPGIALPLEARWIIEWRASSGPWIRTSGENGRGIEADWDRYENPHAERWRIRRRGDGAILVACHEPIEHRRVQATFTLVQDDRYTVRVTGDGFFDYWMLDPAHTPAPLRLDDERIEVGNGWGFVRLEHGRETTYGALRRDWG